MGARFRIWTGTDTFRAEAATVDLGDDRLSATGTQLGADPLPYRLDYELETAAGWVTSRLDVRASGEGWSRRLELRRDADGAWSIDAEATGAPDLALPGGEAHQFAGALDCDLGRSPLTNTMPVRREGLLAGGRHEFLMAWVSVPDLRVTGVRQAYEHVRIEPGAGATIRFRGLDSDFNSVLRFDDEGLITDYPQLARRMT